MSVSNWIEKKMIFHDRENIYIAELITFDRLLRVKVEKLYLKDKLCNHKMIYHLI